jgi:hypothetical protein
MMEGIVMGLDEAIKHCLEVAEQNETSAITYKNCKEIKANMYEKLTAEKAENDCRECAADHRQLAEWLMELKDLRAEQNDQYVFIHELMSELKEAKRLLKMALCELNNGTCSKLCGTCTRVNTEECLDYKKKNYRWIHTAEVLKLIGETNDEP